ncbi:MAG: hypothetical protein H6825_16660, partial [Planctomycetes bacterium]|nr:hypothetical protein [Planctomycetota bacterium]
MQVLGDLVYLENETILPLPWWHRAPLGLMHDTSVHLSVVRRRKPRRKPSGGWRLPDLIVSVTDPANWDRMFHVTARTPDEPGRLAEATHFELPINIALAESATVDNGRFHEVTFICEPTSKQRIKKRHLRKHFRQRGFRETVV